MAYTGLVIPCVPEEQRPVRASAGEQAFMDRMPRHR